MAGRMCNLYLDEDVIQELDDMAEKMGISRSRVANMTLKTAFGGQSLADFYKELLSGVRKESEESVNAVLT